MSVTVMPLTRKELSSRWRINQPPAVKYLPPLGSYCQEESLPKIADQEQSEYLPPLGSTLKINHCWGISSLTQTIRKQIWSSQSSTALVKQSKERYQFSDVFRCSRTEKDEPGDDASRCIQMSSVVAERHTQADLWFRCQPHAVFLFRCQQPPYSCTPCTPNSAVRLRFHDQPRRKIRLRSEDKVPDQQQQDSIMGPIHQEDDQWWALWTFRPSS